MTRENGCISMISMLRCLSIELCSIQSVNDYPRFRKSHHQGAKPHYSYRRVTYIRSLVFYNNGWDTLGEAEAVFFEGECASTGISSLHL